MGNVHVVWNGVNGAGNVIQSAIGYCAPDILSLWVEGNGKNRFPFQEECFSLLRWDIAPCIGGVIGFQILVNGQLIATVAGNVSSFLLNYGPGTYTVRPVNILGIVGPGRSVTVD
jgi:hypothetical protein